MEWYSQGETKVLGEKSVSMHKHNVNWPVIEPGLPRSEAGEYQSMSRVGPFDVLTEFTLKNTFQVSWNPTRRIPWFLTMKEVGVFEPSRISNLLVSVTTHNTRILIVKAVATSNLVTEFQLQANQFQANISHSDKPKEAPPHCKPLSLSLCWSS